MSDTGAVQPAFTPEEWLHPEGEFSGEWVDFESGIIDLRLGHGRASAERDRHALAALALLGQPFGFTWADVDLLRVAEVHYRNTAERDGGSDLELKSHVLAASCAGLAKRIAALLPPRAE